jgi:ABC-type branched-subunit amino acid transport system substrate-binding protein
LSTITGEEHLRASVLTAITVVAVVCGLAGARADTPGVTKTEIKIGNTVPYSGPVSSKGATGKVIEEYFAMINEKGGVNGRKLKLYSLDDAFSPPKTVEAVRRLVEGEEVAFMFAMFGTAQNVATTKYLNGKKVPQLFLVSSSVQWDDPKGKPWSLALPWAPPLYAEAGIDVAYARKKNPNARFAVLYQNDDAGREYLKGVRDALGPDADRLLASSQSFNVTDPTIDSQIAILADSKADVFLIYSLTSRACAQAISKANNLGWKPLRFVASSCANTQEVMEPAGLDVSTGVLALGSVKPWDPNPKNDPAMAEYNRFMKERLPNIDPSNLTTTYAYLLTQALVDVLERCKDDLSRENIMKVATTMKDVSLPMMLPGINLSTTPDDYRPVKSGYMFEFNGKGWTIGTELYHDILPTRTN